MLLHTDKLVNMSVMASKSIPKAIVNSALLKGRMSLSHHVQLYRWHIH